MREMDAELYSESLKGKHDLRHQGVCGRIILKMDIKEIVCVSDTPG
jgi:hypothetical protein